MALGAGRLAISQSDDTNEVTSDGIAVAGAIAVGGAITDNLILYGEFVFFSLDDPTVRVNGTPMTANGVSFVDGMIGPGVAYYVMPVNIYLSTTVGMSKLQAQAHDANNQTVGVLQETKWGFGLATMIGKEFWISHNWGLGLAGQFHYATMEPGGTVVAPRIHTNTFSLLVSATYN